MLGKFRVKNGCFYCGEENSLLRFVEGLPCTLCENYGEDIEKVLDYPDAYKKLWTKIRQERPPKVWHNWLLSIISRESLYIPSYEKFKPYQFVGFTLENFKGPAVVFLNDEELQMVLNSISSREKRIMDLGTPLDGVIRICRTREDLTRFLTSLTKSLFVLGVDFEIDRDFENNIKLRGGLFIKILHYPYQKLVGIHSFSDEERESTVIPEFKTFHPVNYPQIPYEPLNIISLLNALKFKSPLLIKNLYSVVLNRFFSKGEEDKDIFYLVKTFFDQLENQEKILLTEINYLSLEKFLEDIYSLQKPGKRKDIRLFVGGEEDLLNISLSLKPLGLHLRYLEDWLKKEPEDNYILIILPEESPPLEDLGIEEFVEKQVLGFKVYSLIGNKGLVDLIRLHHVFQFGKGNIVYSEENTVNKLKELFKRYFSVVLMADSSFKIQAIFLDSLIKPIRKVSHSVYEFTDFYGLNFRKLREEEMITFLNEYLSNFVRMEKICKSPIIKNHPLSPQLDNPRTMLLLSKIFLEEIQDPLPPFTYKIFVNGINFEIPSSDENLEPKDFQVVVEELEEIEEEPPHLSTLETLAEGIHVSIKSFVNGISSLYLNGLITNPYSPVYLEKQHHWLATNFIKSLHPNLCVLEKPHTTTPGIIPIKPLFPIDIENNPYFNQKISGETLIVYDIIVKSFLCQFLEKPVLRGIKVSLSHKEREFSRFLPTEIKKLGFSIFQTIHLFNISNLKLSVTKVDRVKNESPFRPVSLGKILIWVNGIFPERNPYKVITEISDLLIHSTYPYLGFNLKPRVRELIEGFQPFF